MNDSKYRFHLVKIKFNDGTVVQPRRITVLLGAHDAGKSHALRDIVAAFSKRWGIGHGEPHVIVDIRARNGSDGAIEDAVEGISPQMEARPRNSNTVVGWDMHLRSVVGAEIPRTGLVVSGTQPSTLDEWTMSRVGTLFTAYLPTETRRDLGTTVTATNFTKADRTVPKALLMNEAAQAGVDELVQEIFKYRVLADRTQGGEFSIRITRPDHVASSDPFAAGISAVEQAARMRRFPRLEEVGDGVRNFTTIVAATLVSDKSLFVIDEPEMLALTRNRGNLNIPSRSG